MEPPGALEGHRLELEQDKDSLSLIQERRAAFETKRAALNEQLSLIQAEMRAVDTVFEQIQQEEEILRKSISAHRAALGPLPTFPEELLSEIFSYTCAGYEDYDDDDLVQINPARAKAPFTASSVCRRWRDAAFGAAKLWHCVLIPRLDSNAQRDEPTHILSYVKLVLARSRDSSVDIVFRYYEEDQSAVYDPIMDALVPQRERWRRFVATISGPSVVRSLTEILSLSLPRLRTVDLAYQPNPDNWSLSISDETYTFEVHSQCLANAPSLRALALANIPWPWPDVSASAAKLHTLDLVQHEFSSDIWNILTSQSSLEWAMFAGHSVPEAPPSVEINFSKLGTLWLRSEAATLFAHGSTQIRLPALDRLILTDVSIAQLEPLFTSIRAHLKNLELRRPGDVDVDALRALAKLSAIEYLFFSSAISDELLTGLRDTARRPVMWPKLARIELGNADIRDPENNMALLEVARARSNGDPARDENGDAVWSKVWFEFTGMVNLLPWQRDEIEQINAFVKM
ncbi:hypothetical protein BKA62DRAFT_720294 [Auriculariales sp. MPI-PUGE-AT-0066]|nr:hypothetical protein BKA62DRAFT_720294 [Auriculariales sp. MPI-PUGE-AT-0066]